MSQFIWIASFAVAAILNAVMDRVENEGFYQSIFRDKKSSFWYKRDSWNKATKVFGWKFDAWHLSKSLMLVFIAIAIVLYKPIFNPLYDFGLAGLTWIVVFNLFYNRIFKVKP